MEILSRVELAWHGGSKTSNDVCLGGLHIISDTTTSTATTTVSNCNVSILIIDYGGYCALFKCSSNSSNNKSKGKEVDFLGFVVNNYTVYCIGTTEIV